MPAATLAGTGFIMAPSFAASLEREVTNGMQPYRHIGRRLRQAGGGCGRPAIALVLPDLAKSLTAIATDGPDVFYTGWIADRHRR